MIIMNLAVSLVDGTLLNITSVIGQLPNINLLEQYSSYNFRFQKSRKAQFPLHVNS